MSFPQFNVLKLSASEEKQQWLSLWGASKKKSVFSHPEYVELFVPKGGDGYLATLRFDDQYIFLPFIKSPLPDAHQEKDEEYFDVSSPYGYGGPYSSKLPTQTTKELEQIFWDSISRWAKSENIVTEFIRFDLNSPFPKNYPGEVVQHGTNVIRDLNSVWDHVWEDFEKKVRKDVRKSIALDVTVTTDLLGKHLDDFLIIYKSTMDRRNANEKYYFNKSFFKKIIKDLAGNFVFFHAWSEGTIVSSELVLYGEDEAYSFLGGTLNEAYALHPNHLLKVEIMKWCQSQNIKKFVLGGGATPGDGIEKYKKSFSPKKEHPLFYSGQRVFNSEAYKLFAERWRTKNQSSDENPSHDEKFFPIYRKKISES